MIIITVLPGLLGAAQCQELFCRFLEFIIDCSELLRNCSVDSSNLS